MRIALIAAVAALAASCGPKPETTAPPSVAEPFDLHIEIGRYGAMLNSVQSLTENMPNSGAGAEPTDAHELARSLRETVWEYNLTRSRLCGRGIHADLTCGAPYNPVWLADAPDAAPTMPEIQARADAVGAEVSPLWNAVCEQARAGVADESEKMAVCPME